MAGQSYSPKDQRLQVLQYYHRPWGELIYGTKYQLMSLGIGIGISFPVTDRKKVICKDPRGFSTQISLSDYMGSGIYSASISLPGREKPQIHTWVPYAKGVKFQECGYWNEYKGERLSLIAAGLVDAGHVPGEPGMGKVQVTLNAEGQVCHLNGRKIKDVAQRTIIRKTSKKLFVVSTVVPESLAKTRLDEYKRIEDEWELNMRLLPRPKPLLAISKQQLTSSILGFARQDEKFQKILVAITKIDPDDSLKGDLL